MFALVDCNNFYASCERIFQPSLNDKPIAILSNNDGCVIARSNEVKRLGLQEVFKIESKEIDNLSSLLTIDLESADFTTSIGGAASSLGNVGPGLGDVGPSKTFSNLSMGSKIWCSILMLIGRLELFTVLILFTPHFWSKS